MFESVCVCVRHSIAWRGRCEKSDWKKRLKAEVESQLCTTFLSHERAESHAVRDVFFPWETRASCRVIKGRSNPPSITFSSPCADLHVCVSLFLTGSMLGRGKAGAEVQSFRPPVAMESGTSTNGVDGGTHFWSWVVVRGFAVESGEGLEG